MTEPQRTRRNPRLLAAAGAAGVLAVVAFLLLDVFAALFVATLLVTAVVMAALASDWDRHSTFEERELARARRRQAKWEQNSSGRERDRRRWEAHQARQREADPDR